MFCPIDMLTADGYDMQFGTNVLGTHIPSNPSLLCRLTFTTPVKDTSSLLNSSCPP